MLIPQTPVEFVLSGNHICYYDSGSGGISSVLVTVGWIIGAVWEVIALCFAGWIAVKHFRERRQLSTGLQTERNTKGWVVSELFAALLKTHLFYFAR
jgi:hypothetical protein